MKKQLILAVILVAVVCSLTPAIQRYRLKKARQDYEICRNRIEDTSVRLALHLAQAEEYPKALTPEFFAYEKDFGSLAYELSPDGKSWVLYCPGHQHALVGLGPNLPRTTDKGEFVGVP